MSSTSPVAHALELDILRAAIASHDTRVVLSMEMFERDVQGTLGEYLNGNIREADMVRRCRLTSA